MSEQATHTPGPWESSGLRAYGWDIYDDDGVWLASVNNDHANANERPSDGFPSNNEGEANARLIAAAPELLEQATNALAYIEANRPKGDIRKNFSAINEYENSVCKPLRAAIARATGQD